MNVVKKPLVSVITDIGLDHCAVLGKTIREVAEEKMGITRRGMPVVTGALKRKALDVIKKHPGSMFLFGKDFIVEPETVDWEHGIQKFIFRGFGKNINIDLPLLGKAQLKNCSLAVSTAILLKRNGFQIDVGDIKAGLSNARWRGRFEVIKKRKSCFVVDGAHNPDAVENFIETYKNSPYNKKDTVFIFGILKDKDHLSVIKKLSKFVNKVILVEVGSKRALGLNEMAKEWSRYLPGERIHKANSLTDAMKTAKMHKVVVVTGSLYLTGEFLKNLYQTA